MSPLASGNFWIFLAAAFGMCGCQQGLCSPQGGISQTAEIKESRALQIVINQTVNKKPPYTACVAGPAPAYITVPMMTPYGMMPQQVPLNVVGIGRGTDLEDCREPALEACNQQLDYLFESRGWRRPPMYRCVIATSERCM
jgi:hypothetical protein